MIINSLFYTYLYTGMSGICFFYTPQNRCVHWKPNREHPYSPRCTLLITNPMKYISVPAVTEVAPTGVSR
jgi:hypothetical protein